LLKRIALDPAHRVEHAKTFLSQLLARGPVAVTNIRQAATNAGWSAGVGWAAIKHAKRELGLIAFQQKGAWYWRWPEMFG
jgi:hypothetical protein